VHSRPILKIITSKRVHNFAPQLFYVATPENALETEWARCFPLGGWVLALKRSWMIRPEFQYSLKFQAVTDDV